MTDLSRYCHSSTGVVQFDPGIGTRHFEPWWAILQCDEGIVEYYQWLLLRWGIEINRGSLWGAHVSFIKGEEPPTPGLWGQSLTPVTFRYTNIVEWTNGRHAWVDVWCPALTDLRAALGLPTVANKKYHLTLGRLIQEREDRKTDRGDPAVW